MKQAMKGLLIASTMFVAILSVSGISHAGDCKNVKFHFKNELSSKIKVKKVEISGNDGTWKEDIGNHQIDTNRHYTTNGRRLNKLDSGEAPDWMKVEYNKWDVANNEWDSKTKKFVDRKVCTDGTTYNFNMH